MQKLNYKSYWIGGCGLHELQLKEIEKIIIDNNIKNIVEFGSGQSTRFLQDFRTNSSLDYTITSFDHHSGYSFNSEDVKIRTLEKCNDSSFDYIFENKIIDKKMFTDGQEEKDNFRAKNSFYSLSTEDLPDDIDLVILDGPNGNGRSLAFPHLVGKLKSPCYVMIDDVNHYDFLDRAKQIFDYDLITHIEDKQIHPLFSYAVIRIN